MLGAFLGRQYNFKLGHFDIYTNLYVMLIGEPAARKSTSIKIAKKIIQLAGYDKVSADKTSPEQFLIDLAENNSESDNILDSNLWGGEGSGVSEMYVASDEFNNFIGINNINFISLLGDLWDWNGKPYKNKFKNGKNEEIPNPTISILGGNTAASFSRAFPPEVIEQGFFSRLLLIQSSPTGKKITFPEIPNEKDTKELVAHLQHIKNIVHGVAELSTTAKYLLDKIYKSGITDVDDPRFYTYNNRRFPHLLKLCLVVSASRGSNKLEEQDIIYANTILTHAEHHMPKAMGEFGFTKNGEVVNRLMGILSTTHKPLDTKDLWRSLQRDMTNPKELTDMLHSLMLADKIFAASDGGWLAKKKIFAAKNTDCLDFNLLTNEEREMSI